VSPTADGRTVHCRDAERGCTPALDAGCVCRCLGCTEIAKSYEIVYGLDRGESDRAWEDLTSREKDDWVVAFEARERARRAERQS
jgi:hypothetical protein